MSAYDFDGITSLRFVRGHERNPISPGQLTVEINREGVVNVAHEKGAARHEWSAEQTAVLWPTLVAALQRAHFPQPAVPRNVPPGSPTFEITALRDKQSDTLWYTPGPQHAEVTRLFLTVTAQVTGKEVLDFDMPPDVCYVHSPRRNNA